MIEIWKWIKGFEKSYQVSNQGNIKSFIRKNPKILKPCDNGTGYLQVQLRYGERNNKKREVVLVHKLVAEAFLNYPRIKKDLEVDHIDRNTKNNYLDNLRIVNRRENSLNTKSIDNAKRVYKTNKDKYYSIIKIRNKYYNSGTFNFNISAMLAFKYLQSIQSYIDCISFEEKNNNVKNHVLCEIQSIYNDCPVSKIVPVLLSKKDI